MALALALVATAFVVERATRQTSVLAGARAARVTAGRPPAGGAVDLRSAGAASLHAAPASGVAAVPIHAENAEPVTTLVVEVVDKSRGSAIAGATVSARPARAEVIVGSTPAATDARGIAVLPVEAGTALWVSLDADAGLASAIDPLAPGERRRVRFEVETEQPLPLDGQILDRVTGEPVAGARVRALPVGPPQPAPVTTDVEGRFRLERLTRTDRHLAVEADGYAPLVVALHAGATHDAPLIARIARTARIRARVVTSDGRPIAGASVSVRCAAGEDEPPVSPDDAIARAWSAVTAADGTCTLGALPPDVPLAFECHVDGNVPAMGPAQPLILYPGTEKRLEWTLPAPAGR